MLNIFRVKVKYFYERTGNLGGFWRFGTRGRGKSCCYFMTLYRTKVKCKNDHFMLTLSKAHTLSSLSDVLQDKETGLSGTSGVAGDIGGVNF